MDICLPLLCFCDKPDYSGNGLLLYGTSGAPKNTIDYLHYEWGNKAAGFVSYHGSAKGICSLHVNGGSARQYLDLSGQEFSHGSNHLIYNMHTTY